MNIINFNAFTFSSSSLDRNIFLNTIKVGQLSSSFLLAVGMNTEGKRHKHEDCIPLPPSFRGQKVHQNIADEGNRKQEPIFEVMLRWPDAGEEGGRKLRGRPPPGGNRKGQACMTARGRQFWLQGISAGVLISRRIIHNAVE